MALVQGKGLSQGQSTVLGNGRKLPLLTNVEAINSTLVRFTFSEGMLKNLALEIAINYGIVPQAGGVAVFLESAKPEDVQKPSFVDITTSEMTDGENYVGSVISQNIVNPEGGAVGPPNSVVFSGIGDAPTLLGMESINENLIDVKFSELMRDTPDIRDPSKYTFDNGLVVTAVLDFTGDTVKLITTEQVPGVLYTLTIVP